MLAGLIFATGDADDRPGTLAATLPFGGLTLIEFQARLVVAAGASQLIVVVARLTPQLLGAINRIGRRGVSVDVVRNAVEAAEKIHPLARVLVVADGLVTTSEVIDVLAIDGKDALLTMADRDAPAGFEQVGVDTAWAGLARLDPKRIAEVAALPGDYDFQSTLLRVAAQAQVALIRMPTDAGGVHGIERDSRALADRGNYILSALVSRPTAWADRFVLGTAARLALPMIMTRGMATWIAGLGGLVVGLGGIAAIWCGLPGLGLALTVMAALILTIGAALAWLRDEQLFLTGQQVAIPAAAALATVALGHTASAAAGSASGWILAIVTIALAALGDRATLDDQRQRWWGSPVAYVLVMLIPVSLGYTIIGLSLAGIYAFLTLAVAIEALRENP